MDAVKFIKERDRMCKSYYDAEKGYCSDECPVRDIQCIELDDLSADAEGLVARVEEWSAAHPRKTRQSVFLEQWPNARPADDGLLAFCPKMFDFNISCLARCNSLKKCSDCRREFWMQEVE